MVIDWLISISLSAKKRGRPASERWPYHHPEDQDSFAKSRLNGPFWIWNLWKPMILDMEMGGFQWFQFRYQDWDHNRQRGCSDSISFGKSGASRPKPWTSASKKHAKYKSSKPLKTITTKNRHNHQKLAAKASQKPSKSLASHMIPSEMMVAYGIVASCDDPWLRRGTHRWGRPQGSPFHALAAAAIGSNFAWNWEVKSLLITNGLWWPDHGESCKSPVVLICSMGFPVSE